MSIVSGIKTAVKKLSDEQIALPKNEVNPIADSPAPKNTINFNNLKPVNLNSKEVNFKNLTRINKPTEAEPYKLKKADELAIIDAEDTYKSGLISKKEYDQEIQMIKNPVDLTKDTRGAGVQYHGTSSEIKSFDNEFYTTMNIYGQGFYTTDAVDIASGYSKKGKGKNPVMYEVKKKKDLNLYDMEKPLEPKFRQELEDADIETDDLLTLREVYDELRGEEFMSADDIQEMFSSISFMLDSKGFDGLRHVGGNFTNNKSHNVEIIFKPKDVLDIKKLRIKNDLE
tara:strand:- start:58 stop:909 length:852 start_codon:yes stop_codon:yes gene_type:complete